MMPRMAMWSGPFLARPVHCRAQLPALIWLFMRTPIAVAVLSRDRMFREVLAALLAGNPDLLVAIASDPEALDGEDRPDGLDVVLVDVGGGRGDLDHVRGVRDRWLEAKTIVLGIPREDESVADYIEAGARGYVLRGDSPEALLSAIREVHEGRSPCSPRVVTAVLRRIASLAEEPVAERQPLVEPLTSREREILALLCEGLSNKDVCHRLNITVQTVKNHVHNILTKLQVHRRRDAVRLALELDLLKVSREEGWGPMEGKKE